MNNKKYNRFYKNKVKNKQYVTVIKQQMAQFKTKIKNSKKYKIHKLSLIKIIIIKLIIVITNRKLSRAYMQIL